MKNFQIIAKLLTFLYYIILKNANLNNKSEMLRNKWEGIDNGSLYKYLN